MLHVHKLRGAMMEGVSLPVLEYDKAEARIAAIEGWSWFLSPHADFLGDETITERAEGRKFSANASSVCERLHLGTLPDGNPALTMADGGEILDPQPDITIPSAYGSFLFPNSQAFTFFAVHYPKPYLDGTGIITAGGVKKTLRNYVSSNGVTGIDDTLIMPWNIVGATIPEGFFLPMLAIDGEKGNPILRLRHLQDGAMASTVLGFAGLDLFECCADGGALYIMLGYTSGRFRLNVNGTQLAEYALSGDLTLSTAAAMGFPGFSDAAYNYRTSSRWKGMIGCAGLLGIDLTAAERSTEKALLDAYVFGKYRLNEIPAPAADEATEEA
ncbi:MAG: hypothetical protein PUB69_00400 [Desulfovibrionaceae bacterium]|nr:hypothetical protein [Desulfovibrionaceae bacterium]